MPAEVDHPRYELTHSQKATPTAAEMCHMLQKPEKPCVCKSVTVPPSLHDAGCAISPKNCVTPVTSLPSLGARACSWHEHPPVPIWSDTDVPLPVAQNEARELPSHPVHPVLPTMQKRKKTWRHRSYQLKEQKRLKEPSITNPSKNSIGAEASITVRRTSIRPHLGPHGC